MMYRLTGSINSAELVDRSSADTITIRIPRTSVQSPKTGLRQAIVSGLSAARQFAFRSSIFVAALCLFVAAPAHAGKITGNSRLTLPAAPSTLSATAVSSSQINLSWKDNASNESGFIVQSPTSSAGPWTQIATVGQNATSFSNTGLSAST